MPASRDKNIRDTQDSAARGKRAHDSPAHGKQAHDSPARGKQARGTPPHNTQARDKPARKTNARGKPARETSGLDTTDPDKKALKQVEAELEAAGEAQARRDKFPKDAFLAKGRTKPVAVRFDEFTLERLRTLAARRNTGYQTLLKEFVVERLYEEEKREGIIE